MRLIEKLNKLGVKVRPIKFKYNGKNYRTKFVFDSTVHVVQLDSSWQYVERQATFHDEELTREYKFFNKSFSL